MSSSTSCLHSAAIAAKEVSVSHLQRRMRKTLSGTACMLARNATRVLSENSAVLEKSKLVRREQCTASVPL